MKVILNRDLPNLGEEGDVKDVAKGYARNYLFPKGIALPYTPAMIKIIENRRAEIEARKEEKRQNAMGIKEKLEALELTIAMPAGANGRLYGAVTTQTVADELAKNGFQIERKRIELAGTGFKSVGKYKAIIKLYENQSTEVSVTITAVEVKTTASAPKPPRRSKKDERQAPAGNSLLGEKSISEKSDSPAADETEISAEASAVAGAEEAEAPVTE